MRSLADDMDPEVVAQIDDRLAGVVTDHAVRIPWAIESGSRAWGFPSPDSDYDCRFLFVRARDAYASPWPRRDVIETPLDSVLDVGGWDLVKAVRLVVAGNATVGEWLRSPLVYAGEQRFRDDLLALVERVTDREAIVRHYRHVGQQQWERSGAGAGGEIRLKQAFYALRPAATLHWMSVHDGGVPPMNLLQLLDEAPPPPGVAEATRELIAAKSVTREMGLGLVPRVVAAFVETQLVQDDEPSPADGPRTRARQADAEGTFLAMVDRWGPTTS